MDMESTVLTVILFYSVQGTMYGINEKRFCHGRSEHIVGRASGAALVGE